MSTYSVSKINGLGNVKLIRDVEADFFEIERSQRDYPNYAVVKFYLVNDRFLRENTKSLVAVVQLKGDDTFIVQKKENSNASNG